MGKDQSSTFIFNLEWYAVLSEYPAEVRFEVYEAIMRYASSGTLPDLKPLAKMAFSFIRKEMDYNRERYETIVEKRREAGRRSAESKGRRPPDCGPMQTDAGKARQNQQVLTNVNKINTCQQNQQVSTKPTNASYNDNDNVNDNELSSTTDTRTRAETVAADEKFLEKIFGESESVESFCRSNRISPEDFHRLAGATVAEWRLTGRTHETEQDARRHLINQIRIKLKSDVTDSTDRYARRRGADSAALSPEDYTGEI